MKIKRRRRMALEFHALPERLPIDDQARLMEFILQTARPW